MYKIGVCGHFGFKESLVNGQTIKTKSLTEELKMILGSNEVITVDTHKWKRNPFSLFFKCILLSKRCKNVIILPAQNGIKVFVPLFLTLNKIFNRKLHYVVVGGWLPELLKNNSRLKSQLIKFDVIYVETESMVNTIKQIGLKNIKCLPNFKRLNILGEHNLEYPIKLPYKLCTFSRVMKEKGIEDAINAVESINNEIGKTVFTLDIYGQVDIEYEDRFEELKRNMPDYINYKGVVKFDESVEILKKYYVLLFPTHFYTEGVPGTIIDAYAAGLPIVYSRWENWSEIIDDMETGIGFDFGNYEAFKNVLRRILEDQNEINKMRVNCLLKAEQYMPNSILKNLIENL